MTALLGPNVENVMKVELSKDWCMNMAKIERRAEELHEGCRMPMEQARELAKREAEPAPNMTADELMRLVSRYVEACNDLGEGLFEKPLTTTDALYAKATELHRQILDEVYRLHADAEFGARWRQDSSLSTWFPITAEKLKPMDPLDIEELFDEAAGADEETHVRFARLVERHHGIGLGA